MGVDVGRSNFSPLLSDTLNTQSIDATHEQGDTALSAPTEQCTEGCAHDAEHDSITSSQARFPWSTHVTSTRTLPVTFLVDDDHVPMKLEKLPGI